MNAIENKTIPVSWAFMGHARKTILKFDDDFIGFFRVSIPGVPTLDYMENRRIDFLVGRLNWVSLPRVHTQSTDQRYWYIRIPLYICIYIYMYIYIYI